MNFPRHGLLLLAIFVTAATPATAQSCLPAGPVDAHHPLLSALPDAYWQSLPAWADLPAGERDLLARVSILLRNIRAANPRLTFSSDVPGNVVPLATAPGERFVAEGAPKLDALVTAARAYLHTLDANSTIYVSDGFRSYAVQLETWPRNLRKYMERLRPGLHPGADGRYLDADVCALRTYVGAHYAFPGYSHHQSGRAADFHVRIGDTPELNSDSGGDAVARWCKSPVFAWLHANARTYGFVQAKIDEPWHWVYDPAAAQRPADADYVATSCQAK